MLELQAGAHFDGRYEILARLPNSGAAEVYRVRHAFLESFRIVRILRGGAEQDPQLVRRFERDARAVGQIQCDHLTHLHDYSVMPDGTFYTVWEDFEGERISTYLERLGPFTLIQTLELGIQALEGLEALHGLGLEHGDISPETLHVATDEFGRLELKVSELASTRRLEERERDLDSVLHLYCAPERLGAVIDRVVNQRSDLYSLSVVLYQMVSGRLPFRRSGRSHSQLTGAGEPVFADRFKQEARSLGETSPRGGEIPARTEAVLMRGLKVDPDRRFASARMMRLAFEEERRFLRVTEAERRDTGSAVRISQDVGPTPDRAAQPTEVPARSGSPESLIGLGERAMKEGRLDVVRSCIERLDGHDPAPFGLAELRDRLADMESRRHRMQVMQTEELLEQHLADRRHGLARIALEFLKELAPGHRQLKEYEWRLDALASGTDSDVHPNALFNVARGMARRGELEGARDRLGLLEGQVDAEHRLVTELRREIGVAEAVRIREAGARDVRDEIERAIHDDRLDVAEAHLGDLVPLGVPKTVVDVFRARIRKRHEERDSRERLREIERGFPSLLSDGRWREAREWAREVAVLEPGSLEPARMLSEVDNREAEEARERSLDQGRRAFDRHLSLRQLDSAELALRTLVGIDPDLPEKGLLEAELDRLRVSVESGGEFLPRWAAEPGLGEAGLTEAGPRERDLVEPATAPGDDAAEAEEGGSQPKTSKFHWSSIRNRMRGSSSNSDLP